jgi:hypothetical protein
MPNGRFGLYLLAAALAFAVLVSCNDRQFTVLSARPSATFQGVFDQGSHNDLDILFLVDDSSSMTGAQQNLARNFPVFMGVLRTLPQGLPNVHIAVVTSTLGAGADTVAADTGCQKNDGGRFIDRPRLLASDPRCSAAHLGDGAHFIASSANGTQNNFTGSLEDTFSCLAQVGSTGCGFEHQLEAVRRALGDARAGIAPPPENAGFLRDGAYLAIIWITNEDDCSAPPDSQLFSSNPNAVDADNRSLGPRDDMRCTRYGVRCDGVSDLASAPLDVSLTGCRSDDDRARSDPKHSLIAVRDYIESFRRLKRLPGRVFAAAIAPPTNPFALTLNRANTAVADHPGLAHNCHAGVDCGGPRCDRNGPLYDEAHCDCTTGDPGVRMQQVVAGFGANGAYVSICEADYRESLRAIAQLVGRPLGRQCVNGQLATASAGQRVALPRVTAGALVDPSLITCVVSERIDDGSDNPPAGTVLPPCSAGGTAQTCWALIGEPNCPYGTRVTICRNGFDPLQPGQPCKDGQNKAPDGAVAKVACDVLPGVMPPGSSGMPTVNAALGR